MSKWFNIAGPCQGDIHYMLSPTARLPQLRLLIDQRNYFVTHGPRQVGKTTILAPSPAGRSITVIRG